MAIDFSNWLFNVTPCLLEECRCIEAHAYVVSEYIRGIHVHVHQVQAVVVSKLPIDVYADEAMEQSLQKIGIMLDLLAFWK